ncbi:MAG: heavy metal translocating P-type ATPase [Chlamydiales bacterium]|nr:heavy metal translocating P-type ATPase [Chlamydiales bacterium]
MLSVEERANRDLVPRFWFCLLFTFPFLVRKIDPLIGALLGTIVLVVGNWSFFYRAYKNPFSVYTLFCMSVGLLYVYSVLEALLASAPVPYFGMVASVTTIILLEQLVEQNMLKIAASSLKSFVDKAPLIAHKLFNDGRIVEVKVEEVKEGDSVRVTQGDIIPVDGVIFSGDAFVDESFITSDKKPVLKELGAQVFAGSINRKGTCLVRAIRSGTNSLHAQVAELAKKDDSSSSGQFQLADKIATGAIFVTIALSCICLLFWSLFSGVANGVLVASTLAIGLCPCALLLSNALIKSMAIGEAALQGFAIHSMKALGEIATCNILVVNKNGTLTVGKPTLASLDPVSGVTANELLQIAAGLESNSTHAYAKTILDKAKGLDIPSIEVEDVQEVPGLGIQGKIGEDVCLIGDEKLMQSIDLGYHKNRAEDMRKQGYVVLFCARASKLLGILVLSDPIRRDVKDSLKKFKEEGFTLFCLSGDRRIAVVQLVHSLGFDRFQAEAQRTQKVYTVQKLQKEGKKVLMIGDPLIDLEALNQADAGVALGTKGDLLAEHAPISLLGGNLSSALHLLAFGKKIKNILFQNITFSCVYMFIIACLTLLEYLGPTYGAICTLVSTIIISINTLRLQSIIDSHDKGEK